MDGYYKRMSMRAFWELGKSTLVDQHRDHEQDFEDFVQAVVREMRLLSAVGASTTGGVRGQYREITFLAARPVAQEDWTKSIEDAASACCVLSDQRYWAFE